MLSVLTAILIFMTLGLLVRLLFNRASIYEYVKDDDQKKPVLVAYVKSDGTIIDLTLPRGHRRVGQVYLKEGRGIVRLYQPDRGDGEYEEVGYVDHEGCIFSADGKTPVSRISPEGTRHWYELFLRRHAEVPDADPDPFGRCIETGRFRPGQPKTATLLARAGAALVLYRQRARGVSEAPRLAPHHLWDTGLAASFIFAVIYFMPGITQLFDESHTLLPILGHEWSYIVSVIGLYVLLWMVLHLGKIAWLSVSNDALAYLTMINRQTGIGRWGTAGIIFSLLGMWWSYQYDYTYLPLFIATLIGFTASRLFAAAQAWPIEPRYKEHYEDRQREEDSEAGEIVRSYSWRLDSPLRDLNFETSVSFGAGEIDEVRQRNPFYQDWQEASRNGRVISKQLVLTGEQARQVRRIARYIISLSRERRLTRFEEIQAALDFVQEGNITYALDEACEEINHAKDYYRFPVETMFDRRGDCDCKSVLAAALLRTLGYPVLLLISFEAEHAAIAVGGAPDLDQMPDLFFIHRQGERYYFCETTGEGWTVGKASDLAQRMRDDPLAVVDLSEDLPAKKR